MHAISPPGLFAQTWRLDVPTSVALMSCFSGCIPYRRQRRLQPYIVEVHISSVNQRQVSGCNTLVSAIHTYIGSIHSQEMPPNVCLMWRAAGSLSLSGAIGQIIARHHRRLLSHHGDSATEPNRRQHSNNNHQNPATCLWSLLHSKSPPCRAGQIRFHDTLAQGHK
jgi:hypothetical protein